MSDLKTNSLPDEYSVQSQPVFNETLAQLVSSASGNNQFCIRRPLPSWRRTARLLKYLHRLNLTHLEPADSEKTLTRVVHELVVQLKTCTQTADVTRLVNDFLVELPGIKLALQEDIETAFNCDPAAASSDEIALCYPGVRALAIYRVAHALYRLEVPLLPRLMTEIAHGMTGIDIHPGARIGKRFFIDHGTGVVIGATCIIGNDVKVYQGVTLGARSFQKSENGQVIKGRARHPVIGDGVTIYAGATILGRIKVGSDSVIGGNVWITKDIPPCSKVVQRRPR